MLWQFDDNMKLFSLPHSVSFSFSPILFHLLSFSVLTYPFDIQSANTQLTPLQSVPVYDIDLPMNRTKEPLSTIPI